MTAVRTPEPYVLGIDDDEEARLAFQHRLWRDDAVSLWNRAGFQSGHRLLDLGAGPGFATDDLAEWVGVNGSVVAVDASKEFLDKIEARARRAGAGRIETLHQDAQELAVEASSIDGIYARWLFCFLPDPNDVIARVARALKPGGVVAIQDYVAYTAMRAAPAGPAFAKVVSAIDQSWRHAGGNPDIGMALPTLCAAHGLIVEEVTPMVRVGRPGSLIWRWPEVFFVNYLPRLVATGFLTAADVEAHQLEWASRVAAKGAFFLTPPMVSVRARKPG